MKNPLVSVIVPVYNSQATLKDCLLSALKQNYFNYEILVVDNNSSDDSAQIIKELAAKNKKIKYVFEKNRSRGAARSTGINNAAGQIILFTDSDCLVPKDWVSQMIKPIVDDNELAVCGFQKDLIENYWTKNIQRSDWDFFSRSHHGKYISHLDTKNFAVKTALIKKYMFNDQVACLEDLDLYFRIKDKIKIRFLFNVSVGHYHANSFLSVIRSNFSRGFWAHRIFVKNKPANEPMIESISFSNFLKLPFWLIFKLFSRPVSFPFIVTSAVSWRFGILWSMIKKI